MSPPQEPRCWQCGAPGDAGSAYKMVLYADTSRRLSALDFPVERGKRIDKVKLRLPRCEDCRFRTSVGIAIAFAGMIAGAIAGPIVHTLMPKPMPMPAWFVGDQEGIVTPPVAIGAVVGLVLAMLAVAAHSRLSGIRSLMTHPSVIMLRQAGWRLTSD